MDDGSKFIKDIYGIEKVGKMWLDLINIYKDKP